MPAYLITGCSGSGKTTIMRELKRRGVAAFDGDDVPGLTRWEDAKTGEPTEVDADGYVDYTKVGWNWNGKVLEALIQSHSPLFLCGSASNQLAFYDKFTIVFNLVVDTETLKHRILTRTDHNYGKHPQMLQEIINNYDTLLQESLQRGAVTLDAARPIAKVVDDIMARAKS